VVLHQNHCLKSERKPVSSVTHTIDQGIGILCLNRPSAYNALSLELIESLIDQFESLGQNQRVKAILLHGAGRGFCAGHDLKQLKAHQSKAYYENVFTRCSRLMMTLQKIRPPVIAAVHGMATAAGCQLVASCDLAVASENARFATPGVNIGLFCSTPMVALTRNIAAKNAMEMLLTGDPVDAETARSIGLVNRVAAEGEHLQEALALAEKIVRKSPVALATGKEAFYRQSAMTTEEAYAYCSRVMTHNMLTSDAQEGISAQLEKRSAKWPER